MVPAPPRRLSTPSSWSSPTSATQRNGTAPLPPSWAGPRPTGGVGGTRRGVKCLHAHYAWYLAGGDDPVGRWVAEQLGEATDGAVPPWTAGRSRLGLLVRAAPTVGRSCG